MTDSLSTHALHDLSVHDMALALRNKQVSSVELAQHFLQRSRDHAHLGAFVAIDETTTLAQAQAADQRIAQGSAGALEGVPIAHKDIFVTKDFATTAAQAARR